MRPSREEHSSHALPSHRELLSGKTVSADDVLHKRLDVSHARRGAKALAGNLRAAMAPGVPGKEREPREIDFGNDVSHSAGMLVTTMKQQDRTAGCRGLGRPVAVEERSSVGRSKRAFVSDSHEGPPFPIPSTAAVLVGPRNVPAPTEFRS